MATPVRKPGHGSARSATRRLVEAQNVEALGYAEAKGADPIGVAAGETAGAPCPTVLANGETAGHCA